MNAQQKNLYAGWALAVVAAAFVTVFGTMPGASAHLPVRTYLVSYSQLIRIQTQDRNLAGVWISDKGERFEVKQNGNAVRIEYRGSSSNPSLKGVIAGQYDGKVSIGGAYEATEGAKEERGVVRFVLRPDGRLEGTQQPLTTGGPPQRVLLTRENR